MGRFTEKLNTAVQQIKLMHAQALGDEARAAAEQGQSVYMLRMTGEARKFSDGIVAVEAEGWRLDQMSFVQGQSEGQPEGWFLFRRNENGAPAPRT
ncbi:hypothetical protein OG948_19830 [Embleya sp. NBC_00888]|uniref:hypothetical protein n=1 Tax=Embleya sp. NBC_00888 TaxID=2975960 RepID=UPI00386C7D97|nr:hypothetical protein OG948_19830 [Embleya sp. NBC_00888]